MRIEEYALIGDLHTAALVGSDGSIDWLCLPHFDSGACFAALLGDQRHGRWLIAPAEEVRSRSRRYVPETLVLETDFETGGGAVRVIDFMPPRDGDANVVRIVRGLRGSVRMRMQLVIRFDYGSIVPWVRRVDGMLRAVGGPDALCLNTPVETRGEDFTTVAEFTVSEGESVPFVLSWGPSAQQPSTPPDAEPALRDTRSWWEEWSAGCGFGDRWREAVMRSLITLKALTYAPTGGIVAAPTTSLPEQPGGVRNWDYRYCWLRDATFTLYSLISAGYTAEAIAWRDWLLRAVAGDPADLNIMYGAAGERRLPELELDWLPGYEGARPVRIGNAAVDQRQLDVFGEVMDTLHAVRKAGITDSEPAWQLSLALMEFLESNWREPDEGIWEVRGDARQFTHSKVMAWVAFDRAVKAVERFGRHGPAERWRRARAEVHEEVCREGYDSDRGSFTQYYGSRELDASLLMVPLVGFLPALDERVTGTVAAIERELCRDGFVLRYSTSDDQVDGLPPGEATFLPCTFWLADNLAMQGREQEARTYFERLLAVRNDVGLLSESYDTKARRLMGNFPQAFTHVSLINTAHTLAIAGPSPALERAEPT
jgi:GH15 family glucan-1,4-alpha-glucosidase